MPCAFTGWLKQLVRPSVAPLLCLWCIAFGMARTGVASAQEVEGDSGTAAKTAAAVHETYGAVVLADQPVAHWSFDQKSLKDASGKFALQAKGAVKTGVAGPLGSMYPLFGASNQAIDFPAKAGYLILDDTPLAEETNAAISSPLRFSQGDVITLEAWVDVRQIANGQQMYVVGKGRTQRAGYAAENQNYALRLAGKDGQAVVSFLFRDAENKKGSSDNYHRWNSNTGFGKASGWHHIAVTYEFGKPESIRGYIDGESVTGTWDYGGATTKPPVVDDDQVWIGSSMGGNPSSTFQGGIDEVAIYRSALSPERIHAHARIVMAPSYVTDRKLLSRDKIFVEVFHGVPDKHNWSFSLPAPFESFEQRDWALVAIPRLYNSHAVRDDRSNPFVVRLSGLVEFPEGVKRVMLRARSGARLFVDGSLVLDNRHPGRGSDGHGAMYRVESKISSAIRPLQPGDYEQAIDFTPTPGEHRVQVDLWVGGKGRRPELGEMCLATSTDGTHFDVLSAGKGFPLDDASWEAWSRGEQRRLEQVNASRRQRAGATYAKYWERRHEDAREYLAQRAAGEKSAVTGITSAAQDPSAKVNQIIESRLSAVQVEPLANVSDEVFLRRSTLDVLGTVPTLEQQKKFFALPEATRRGDWIAWLLEQPGWADHWVAYWQDVLAENPNLVNPTLNNTGPFRFWIHESFLDNKPFDRFATELILMEGSPYFGGPAGFALATQNDSPMAAKAHILAQAFLGMEMKCARCHDAPYHDFKQKDLFNLAAMLKRGPESVPKTSTIPGTEDALKSLLVKVTLKPGEPVPPEWPFADLLAASLSPDVLEHPTDRREQLAALVTSPGNRRFGQVIVNRLWQRYLGRGIVEPIDDWEHPEPSHPELLDLLEIELIASRYDLKHVASVILNSRVYQRQVDNAVVRDARRAMLFAGPAPRKLSAEQVVDSLFAASGKSFRTEELNIDVDGLRNLDQSLGFGYPERAWEFVATNNERDRPSLSLPGVQSFTNVLETFGWRASRPDPTSIRTNETTVLQPATLANGTLSLRASQLSDDSRVTALALEASSPNEFVEAVYQQFLTRPPTDGERAIMAEYLSPGFAERVVKEAPMATIVRPRATGVAWTNHLQPEANDIKVNYAIAIEKGDTPTARLEPQWRERAEDFVWTLINLPEFVLLQ